MAWQARWFNEAVRIPLAEWWIDTVLGTWEEFLKSLIREAFANGTRVVNGFFGWLVAALPKDRALGRCGSRLPVCTTSLPAAPGCRAAHRLRTGLVPFSHILHRNVPVQLTWSIIVP